MTLTPIVASGDGPRVTVNTLIKQPRLIPRRVISMLQNQFMADSLFRSGGDAPGGVVAYEESTPQYPQGNIGIREEFGEYPIITTVEGQRKVALAVDRGFAVLISEEMRRRNQMDRVNLQMTQGKNLMVRAWDGVVQAALLGNASVPTMAVPLAWTDTTAKVRSDVLDAKYAVTQAQLDPANTDPAAGSFFGFVPDTMVMSTSTAEALLNNDDVNKFYSPDGPMAAQNLMYTGKMERKILDLDVLVSRTWPNDKVWIGERKTVGFISDEVALNSTPLYAERPSLKYWRSDTGRVSAVGIDQPLAGIILTGVQ